MATILALNPGGSSTRIALYHEGGPVWSRLLRHRGAAALPPLPQEMAAWRQRGAPPAAGSPLPVGGRLSQVRSVLAEQGLDWQQVGAVVGRGGPYRPLPAGTWRVGPALLEDIIAGRVMAEHPSNLGALLAWTLAEEHALPAFVVDPVCVDELSPVARISGLPELPRRSLFHALNIRAVARRHAASQGRPMASMVLLVAHLGSGVSVALLREGRVVDVNNSADEGPFSVSRAGSVPVSALVELAGQPGFSATEFKRRLLAGGGMLAHLGTADLPTAEERAAAGDAHAALILEAMAYQVSKAIGGLAAAASGQVDAILLTGGMSHSAPFLARIRQQVAWIAPLHVFPGEDEMAALAAGVLEVLSGHETARTYPPTPK